MPNTAPPYTVGGITRPALIFDNAGNIILTPEAAAFQAAYGTKALYAGLPANTPFPPVAPTLSAPADNNGGVNSVLENAAIGTQVGIAAQANNPSGLPLTYSLSDSAGGRFQIDAATGVVTVAAALDYETAPGFAYDITVQATDGILTTSQTFTIGVGNVNEAPAGTNGAVAASEDTNYVFSAADFGFTDPSDSSAPNALTAVRIATLPATGTLLNNGVAVVAGDSVSAAAIAAGQLVFVPVANTSGAGYASFTFQVRDNGGTANGGVDLDATPNTITINVNAVNDAPTATNLTQSLVVNEDAAATQLFTVAPAMADIDGSTFTATLTLDAAAGVLIGAGTGVLSAGVLTYTMTGDATTVGNALAAVTYDSAPNFNGATSVGVTIGDGANGPQGVNPTGSINITVNAVNDAPAATNLTQSLSVGEDGAAATLFTLAPVVADIDSSNVTATLTLDAAAGVLNGAGAGVLNAGVLTYTITGTAAAVNAALAAVTYDSANNFNGPTSVGVTVDDGAAGPQGTNPTGTISITVNAVNDAPTATNLTQSLSIGEDDAATTLFTLAPVVSDIDSATVTATLTLDATAGVLTGAGAGVLNAGVLTYTITGTPAAVTTALAGVAFDSAPDFNGITDVGITIDDGANGPQGSNPIGTGTVTINAVNDAPTATNLTQSLSVGEDGAAATLFTLAPVVADIDSTNVTAALTLDAAAGVLTGAGAGVLNAGVLTYTITGTAATVTAALAAVTYDSADNFAGPTNVGVAIDDGSNGPHGTNPTGTVSITVNAVNDAPTATNLSQSLTINEDAAATTLFTLPPVTADIDSANITATLTLDAPAGVLVGAGAGVLNAGVLTYTITGTPAAVNAALAAVTYDSAPNFFGTPSVGIAFDDGANGPQGSNPTGSIDITVNSVNDAPTVAATANNPAYVPGADLFSGVTASTVESGQVITQLVLTVTNISDTDESLTIDGDIVALVDGTVSGAPTATLGVTYAVAVSGGTATVTITSPGLSGAQTGTLIDALSYTNTVVSPGDPARVVTIVSLTDDGGTALGGVATGTPGIASTVNFNIAPSIGVDGEITYVENDTATLVDSSITVSDPDDANMESATVVISSGYAGAQDVLTFTNTANITGNLVGNTLTATGTATRAEYETFLESVRYQNSSNDPTADDRILTYTVNDGFVDSPSDTATIHVEARNDEPTLTATAANPGFTENGAAVDLFSGPFASTVEAGQTLNQIIVTVTNVAGTGATESLLIDGTTVELNNGNSEVTATNGMTASVVLAGGTATVTVSRATGISAADMATLVDNLAYGNTSEDPGSANRVVTVTSLRDDGLNGGGNDNINSTLAVSSTVTVTPVNDEPTLTTTGLNPGFTENGAAVDLFSTPVVASAIEAGQNLNTLILTVSNVAGTGATENLTIDGTVVELNNGNSEITATNGMTASVVLAGGVATVTISKVGGVSAAVMQSIVDGLAYDNTSENPGAATRVVTLTSLSDTGPTGGANDNIASLSIASSVAVTPVNDAPLIDLVPGGGIDTTATTATFSEGSGPPSTAVFITSAIDFSDADGATLAGATVTLTDFVGGQDVLTVSGNTSGSIGGVSYSVSGNVITFSGSASVAAYEAAVEAVQYNNSSENPADGDRHFDIQVTDGTDASTVATATVNVVGQDDAPVVTIPADAAVPTAFSNTDTAISGISIADVDAGSGTVTTQLSVTNGTVAVTLAGSASISAGANGTATLTLSGTVADINATLANNVTFHSTDGFAGQANLTVLTNDGGNSGLGGPLTDTEVVHIGVVPQVWFIDNTNFGSLGAGGSGTIADPFRTVADFNNSAGPGANDYIVVRTGTGTYTGEGLDLQNGQQVWGAGETLSFTNPVNGNVVNIPNAGTRPTISVTGGDQGIDLASNNTIRNVNISTASGTSGLDDGNNDVGTLVVRNMDISGAGQAVDIDQGGTLDVQLGTVSSSGGTFGIQLAGTAAAGVGLLSGSFSAAAGAISGSASVGFMVGNGGGADNTGGTAAISYGGSISTGAGVHAVNIQDHATGAVTLSGNLTYSGGNGGAIVLDDNSSNFTFSGSALNFSTGSSNAINITDQTGGTTVAFSGTLNIDTTLGTGVNLGGTNAANFNFTGGNMTIDATGSGGGFIATGGGTVNVTGSGNHIATTTGTALNISNTTIGASDVTFQDISANGAVNGIVLNNTGSSGGLIVTGTGSTDGSGGTIQSTTGRGASFINTSDVSLSNMNFTNAGTSDLDADNSGLSTGDNLATNAAIHLQTVTTVNLDNINISGGAEQGINGNTVANFTLSNSSISNVGNEADEDGIHFFNMSGASAITNTTITGSFDDNLNLQTQSGNLDLTITGGSATNSTLGSGYLFGIRGTTVANISLDGVSSTNNFSGGIVADAFDTATMNLRVNNSTSSGNNDQLSVSAGDSSSVDLEATGNTLSSVAAGDFVVISLLGSAFDTGYVFDARIHGNTISVADELAADGVFVFNAGGGVINAAITDNMITYAGGQRAIIVQQGQDGAATTRATITGNNIDLLLNGGNNADNAIVGTSGVADPSGAGSFLDLNIGGAGALANIITHSLGGTVGAGGGIRVRQRFADNINLDGYAGGSTDTNAVIDYLNSRNFEVDPASATVASGSYSGNASPAFISVSVSTPSVLEDGATNLVYTLTRNGSTASSLIANFAITGTASATSDFTVMGSTTFVASTGLGTVMFAAGSATAIITVNPIADGDATEFDESVVLDVGNSGTANGSFARGVITDDAPLIAAAGGVQASTPTPGETHLTQAQLDVVVAAAILQWKDAGTSPAQLAALAAITFTVDDLSGNTIGERTAGHIVIDTNAAGHGWFVDSTLSDNFEFAHAANAAGTQLFADPASAAAGHLDLLTAVVHEMGHALGLAHSEDADDVMADTLVDGERRLPDTADLPQANAGPVQAQANAQAPLLPVIRGTAGNDTIYAGSGGNILVGEAGADQFVFASVPASVSAPLTHVADYSFIQGDSFDFSALTASFHGSNVNDAYVVRAVEDASGTFATLQVNTANWNWGSKAGPTWVDVAQIDGAHAGDDVSVLIDNGAIHRAQIHVDLLV
ncbi:tandem-95 repeat protein [Bradyrhizobium sp.]|uniref:tandem-95 repeat protein n=1 Tax=Bradyrhizobium sp. TaxID=376 RepID=UPI00271948E6|nr:tandem-95 repeat protein [Bradyrhizobium sp.]MDO9299008.1 tandem-95 repeat protein [Bradyrhizobium sp.]